MRKIVRGILGLSTILAFSSPVLASCEDYPFNYGGQVKTTIDGGYQASFTVRLPFNSDDPVFEAAAITIGEADALKQLSDYLQITLKKACETNKATSIDFGAGTSQITAEQACSFIQLEETQTLIGAKPIGACSVPFKHILVTYGISSRSERNAKKVGYEPYPNIEQQVGEKINSENVREERRGRSTGFSSYTTDW